MKSSPAFEVPDGYCLNKKGGRPLVTARNIAVLLARQWRMAIGGAKAIEADAWIIETWLTKGFKEEANVRRAQRKGAQALGAHIVITNNANGFCLALPVRTGAGALAWVWYPGLFEAQQLTWTGEKSSKRRSWRHWPTPTVTTLPTKLVTANGS